MEANLTTHQLMLDKLPWIDWLKSSNRTGPVCSGSPTACSGRTDAEDIVQDAFLRWHQSATPDIKSPVAFLVTITTRLCVDRLRELKQEREHRAGPWVPEPIAKDNIPSPETQCELADDVSVAFLAVLERLGPEERATFLLHEVFDYDYPDVAQMTGKSEPACRQMISRARPRVRKSRPRFTV